MKLHTRLLIALALVSRSGGPAFGWWLPGSIHSTSTCPSSADRPIFLRLIFAIVVPMVFSALVIGVYELGRGHGLAGVASRTARVHRRSEHGVGGDRNCARRCDPSGRGVSAVDAAGRRDLRLALRRVPVPRSGGFWRARWSGGFQRARWRGRHRGIAAIEASAAAVKPPSQIISNT